jgi:hypothetical protein
MDRFTETAMGAKAKEAKGDSPCGMTEGAEPLIGESLNGVSRKRETCVPKWKMRILHLIFYF